VSTVKFVEPRSVQWTSICARGEAGVLEVSFSANGQVYRNEEGLYFECNSFYAIKVDVSPGFDVTVSLDLK